VGGEMFLCPIFGNPNVKNESHRFSLMALPRSGPSAGEAVDGKSCVNSLQQLPELCLRGICTQRPQTCSDFVGYDLMIGGRQLNRVRPIPPIDVGGRSKLKRPGMMPLRPASQCRITSFGLCYKISGGVWNSVWSNKKARSIKPAKLSTTPTRF